MSRKDKRNDKSEQESENIRDSRERKQQGDKPNRSSRGGKHRFTRNSRNSNASNSNTNGSKHAPLCGIANDVTWYTKSPLQVKNAANISFLTATGKPVNQFSDVEGLVASSKFGAPGVMILNYIPTYGNPQVSSDPLNYAINILYNDLRYKNSGATNYEAQDYMGYMVAMDSAYSFAGYMKRIYGLINTYSSLNRYWPKAILEGMHVDMDTFRFQLPAFRQLINNYIARINTMAVPTVLPIFERHYWMCANVYKDAESSFAQVYVNNPQVYGVKDYESGDIIFKSIGASKTSSTIITDITFDRIKAICEDITSRLIFDEDYNIMSGDTIKKWGNSLFNISYIDDNYQLLPVYDAGVLIQIMNSQSGGYIGTFDNEGKHHAVYTAGTDIYHLHDDVTNHCFTLCQFVGDSDEKTRVTFKIIHTQSDNFNMDYDMFNTGRNILINIPTDDVSPEHVLESTRCTSLFNYITDPTTPDQQITAELMECGADTYTVFDMYYYWTNSKNYLQLMSTQPYCSLILNTGTAEQVSQFGLTLMQELILMDSFDWHPIISVMSDYIKDGEHELYSLPPFVDTYNTALVDPAVIARIHEVANFSLFNITETTSYSG